MAARDAAVYVYVREAAVADHYGLDHVVFALEQLDVRREVLREQVVVREMYDGHLLMRVHLARADAGEVLRAPQESSPLKAAQVDHRVAEHLAGRAAERARVESVR